jgi:hypothetical protein
MTNKKLNNPKTHQTLILLKQELENTQTADKNERTTILHLIDDIQELINHIDEDAPLLRQTNQRLSERLRKAIVLFEVSYPTLSTVIEKTLDILDNSGI